MQVKYNYTTINLSNNTIHSFNFFRDGNSKDQEIIELLKDKKYLVYKDVVSYELNGYYVIEGYKIQLGYIDKPKFKEDFNEIDMPLTFSDMQIKDLFDILKNNKRECLTRGHYIKKDMTFEIIKMANFSRIESKYKLI